VNAAAKLDDATAADAAEVNAAAELDDAAAEVNVVVVVEDEVAAGIAVDDVADTEAV